MATFKHIKFGDGLSVTDEGAGVITVAAGASASTPPDATTSSKGIVQLAGDLAGTAASPQIAAGAIIDADVAAANKDGTAATPSLRTLGTGAQQAAAGNDSRFLKAAVAYGTSLPASPVDGQEAILVDSTTNPSYQWAFRYNAGSSSAYKWEFVGGPPAQNLNGTDDSTTTTGGWADLTGTPGPQIQVARAGDYIAMAGASGYNSAAGNYQALGIGINNAAPLASATDAAGTNYGSQTASGRLTLAAGDYLKVRYTQGAAGTAHFSNRWLNVWPVRVA